MSTVILKPIKRPLGRILVDAGLVSVEKLNAALEEQQRTNRFVGEILVAMGELDPRELELVLSLQRELAEPDKAMKIAAGVRKMLGEILVLAKKITPEQLALALKEQKRTSEKTGEVLVRLGLVTQREVDAALSIQNTISAGPKLSTRLRLGELLVAAGYLTREQLDEALGRQLNTDAKLGQVLVDGGFVEAKVITRFIRLQEMLMRAVLIAALTLSATAMSSEAVAGSVTLGKIQVSAVVLAYARLNVLKQQHELMITNADVRRGYVQAESASIIEVRSNTPKGIILTFEATDLPFKETSVNIQGRDINLLPMGGMVNLPGIGKSIVPISYRFVLAQGTQPGTYAWPFSLSVSPIQ